MQLSSLFLLLLCISFQRSQAAALFNTIKGLIFETSKTAQISALQNFERNLLNALNLRMEKYRADPGSFEHLKQVAPVQFPEASAMREFVIDKAAGYVHQWVENNPHALDSFCRQITKHVLYCRPDDCQSTVISGRERASSSDRTATLTKQPSESASTAGSEHVSKAFTTFLIFRPSFAAQLNPANVFPADTYVEEAKEVSAEVLKAISENPNDQIIFVGLQGGSSVALFTAWKALIEIDQLFFNYFAYGDELHQIKLFLFDTDCILSAQNAPTFPISAWDILRFYSPNYASEVCQYTGMAHVGLQYKAQTNYLQLFASLLLTSEPQDAARLRTKFIEYDRTINQKTKPDEQDDAISVISSSTTIAQKPRSSTEPAESKLSISDRILLGMNCLKDSVRRALQFKTIAASVYHNKRRAYLQRDVDNCAEQLTEALKTGLVEQVPSGHAPTIPNGIANIKCTVTDYSIVTRLAGVTCWLIGRDKTKSKSIRFELMVEKLALGEVLSSRFAVSAVSDELNKVAASLTVDSTSDPDGFSAATATDDDRSHHTTLRYLNTLEGEKNFQTCLSALFANGKSYLSFLNPPEEVSPTQATLASAASTAAGGDAETGPAGFLSIQTKLPYSLLNCACKFTLKSSAEDYLGMYRHAPNLFFDIFSATMHESALPSVCEGVIQPPRIEAANRGHAEFYLSQLTELFQRDPSPSLSDPQEITATTGSFQKTDPFTVFAPSVKKRISSCLAETPLDRLYDCNAEVTRWAGYRVCPEYCRSGGRGAHLCSRVLVCGDGLFLGFRGASLLENTFGAPAAKESSLQALLAGRDAFSPPVGSLAAYTMKQKGGRMMDSTLHFAAFFNPGVYEQLMENLDSSEARREDDGPAFEAQQFMQKPGHQQSFRSHGWPMAVTEERYSNDYEHLDEDDIGLGLEGDEQHLGDFYDQHSRFSDQVPLYRMHGMNTKNIIVGSDQEEDDGFDRNADGREEVAQLKQQVTEEKLEIAEAEFEGDSERALERVERDAASSERTLEREAITSALSVSQEKAELTVSPIVEAKPAAESNTFNLGGVGGVGGGGGGKGNKKKKRL